MSKRRRNEPIGVKAHLALQAALLFAAAGLALPTAAHADTNYFYEGPTVGTWDTTSAIWATPLSTSSLGDWVSSGTSDANFLSTIASANISLSSPITANILSFSQSGTIGFTGSNTLTLNQIDNNVAGQTINFFNPIQSSGPTRDPRRDGSPHRHGRFASAQHQSNPRRGSPHRRIGLFQFRQYRQSL